MGEVDVIAGVAPERDIEHGGICDLRMRPCGGQVLVTDKAGRFVRVSTDAARRIGRGQPGHGDLEQLERNGLLAGNALARLAGTYAMARRRALPRALDYLILVPTLRCNLACSYCQVSRAAIDAQGFDWSRETLDAILARLANLAGRSVKIEFQGGEPTLRPDLIRAVIAGIPARMEAHFVICTNLQNLDDDLLALFDRKDVSISTSLDGPLALHARQRQGAMRKAEQFDTNLRKLLERYGPEKISALPTIDPLSPPDIDALIDSYAGLGLDAIFLRPVNYQGFARKRHPASRDNSTSWPAYHRAFVARLIERNWADRGKVLEESYFSMILRRIFRPGENRHVDLRNPSPIGRDYIVIDHDGRAYPSDEARMLSRSGVIDLAIGDVQRGWDTPQRAALERVSTSDGDPACERCAYQAFCGRDIFDDISRYGRVDVAREQTDFCRRHIDLFDYAFGLIHSTVPAVQYSLRRWLGVPGETGALVVA